MMGRLNVNRAELSRRLRVEDSWVGKRLNGRTEISLSDFQKIADALDVDIHDLLPRDRRASRPTDREDRDLAVTGTFAHPDHPILATAIRLPQPVIPQPRGRMRPAPTGL